MGIRMESVLEAAILSCACLENWLYSRNGVSTEDDVELLRIIGARGVRCRLFVLWPAK